MGKLFQHSSHSWLIFVQINATRQTKLLRDVESKSCEDLIADANNSVITVIQKFFLVMKIWNKKIISFPDEQWPEWFEWLQTSEKQMHSWNFHIVVDTPSSRKVKDIKSFSGLGTMLRGLEISWTRDYWFDQRSVVLGEDTTQVTDTVQQQNRLSIEKIGLEGLKTFSKLILIKKMSMYGHSRMFAAHFYGICYVLWDFKPNQASQS